MILIVELKYFRKIVVNGGNKKAIYLNLDLDRTRALLN
jgi:hypothetical protein